jgi:TolB-like protein
MKKQVLFLFMILLVISISSADERSTITVLDFKTNDISDGEAEVFLDYISSHIVELDKYRVIDRTQRENILAEIKFSFTGCTDEECQLEIGRMLAAQLIIVGSLGKVGEQYIINTKVIDVETGETIRTASEKYTSIDDMVNDSQRVTRLLLDPESTGSDEDSASASQTPDRIRKHFIHAGVVLLDFELMIPVLNYSYLLYEPFGISIGVGYDTDWYDNPLVVQGGVSIVFTDLFELSVIAGASESAGLYILGTASAYIGLIGFSFGGGYAFGYESMLISASIGARF